MNKTELEQIIREQGPLIQAQMDVDKQEYFMREEAYQNNMIGYIMAQHRLSAAQARLTELQAEET